MRHVGDERRRYPRSRRGFPIVVEDSAPGVFNHVDNMSCNGILCHTVKPVPLMTKLSIVLELPKPADTRVECEGVVVRCDPHDQGDDHFKVAILFTKIEEAALESIKCFVEEDYVEK